MVKFFTILIFGLITINLSAQTQVENLLRDAKSYNKAYLDRDFETFTALTVPSIVELAGGDEVMAKIAKEQYETTISTGMNFISITPNKPSKIMLGGNDLHAILSQQVITQMGDDQYKKTAYFLASSNDEGKTWTFVDLEPYDAESIKIFVPSFTGELEIPVGEFAEKIEK
jgi:hypothetical protein